MKKILTAGLASALIFGCASAQQDASQDTEPQVTSEVTDIVARIAGGAAPQDRFTERGAAMTLASGTAARQLKGCDAPSLRLLDRRVKGEDRQYLYRLNCGNAVWLLEVDYNKASRINRMELRPSE
ncbi:hypothetical protein AB4Z19_06505 [Pseudoduganella sp. RAF19]|uniref:hypothetical protein n=1 Tax=Pseudoduganella sp. RAF19 TaxID=3233052 RepID=UPI003F9AC405